MQPEIHLGPLTLQSFGLMMGLGFVVAGLLTAKRLKEIGRPPDWAYEMVFAALVGGLVGARLWSVVENWDEAKDDLLGSLFSGTGLVFYGGLLGGAIAVLGWAKWRGTLDAKLLRRASPPARGRLRDRPDRLPARRRRRLRQAVGRPVGDVVSGRHGADDGGGPPDAGLRDARDGRRRLVPLAHPRPRAPGRTVRALPRARGRRALPRRVPAHATTASSRGSPCRSSSRWG